MQHPHDGQRGIGDPVVNHVASVKMRPQARRYEIPSGAEFGIPQQWLEPFFDPANKASRRVRVVLGNERPDAGEIILGFFGYVEGERAVDFF